MLAHIAMYQWAEDELKNGNRLKASRIYKVAQAMEQRYEEHEQQRMKEAAYFY